MHVFRRLLQLIDWFIEPWLLKQNKVDAISGAMRPRLAIGLSLFIALFCLFMLPIYIANNQPFATVAVIAVGLVVFGANPILARLMGAGQGIAATVGIELFVLHAISTVGGLGARSYTLSTAAVGAFIMICLLGIKGGTVVVALMSIEAVVLYWLESIGVYAPPSVALPQQKVDLVTAIFVLGMVLALGSAYEGTHERARSALSEALRNVWTEMDLAQKIQTILLPRAPQLNGYRVAAKMKPAADVGGDYYDFITIGEQQWVVIGDVSGHGVSAGLVMMMVQAALQATISNSEKMRSSLSPAEVIGLVNRSIWNSLSQIGDKYMTISVLCFEGGKMRFAGFHQDILIYRAKTRSLEVVKTNGAWIGVFKDIFSLLPNNEIELEEGDKVLLYTDGVTEAVRDDKMLDLQGLCTLFEQKSKEGRSPEGIVEELFDQLRAYEANDDMTLIAMERAAA